MLDCSSLSDTLFLLLRRSVLFISPKHMNQELHSRAHAHVYFSFLSLTSSRCVLGDRFLTNKLGVMGFQLQHMTDVRLCIISSEASIKTLSTHIEERSITDLWNVLWNANHRKEYLFQMQVYLPIKFPIPWSDLNYSVQFNFSFISVVLFYIQLFRSLMCKPEETIKLPETTCARNFERKGNPWLHRTVGL